MKTFLLMVGSCLLIISCSEPKKKLTTITGHLQHAPNMKVYFEKITTEGDVPVDSATTDDNGNFELVNKANELEYYLLRTGNQNVAYLVLRGGETLTVTGDAKDLERTYDVTGSEDTRILLQLKRYETHLSDSMNRTYAAFRDENPLLKDSIGAILQHDYDSLIRDFAIGMIRKNFSSLVSLSATKYLDKQKDFSLFVSLNDSLQHALGKNRFVEAFSKEVDDMKRLPYGSSAPEIKLASPEGKLIALSSLKGKIVVIDFWASWCGPCRREMPEMVELYKEFKNRGIEIYGVSLDENTDAWKSAIASDHITWLQVSDLKKWDSKPVLEYGIEEIPQTVLIDRDGNIVAKGLDMNELRIKIQALLNS